MTLLSAVAFCKRHLGDDSEEARKGRIILSSLLLGGAAVKTSMTIYSRYLMYSLRKSKVEQASNSKNELISIVKQPNEDTERITNLSIMELVEKLQNEELKPEMVLAAYQAKALDVDKQLNCVTEPVTGARNDARHLDATDKAKGPMYGIPISIKDNIALKGYDCTKGLSMNINHPMPNDCVLVEVLKKQGAIPFMKTNIPQTLMSYQCSNPIFGRTKNLYKSDYSPGGSSGGEAALISAGGSIIGIGTDIGGSIRIPAHMSGICGIKSSVYRLSLKGNDEGWKKYALFCPATGFLSRDMDGIILAMRSVLVPMMFELDPNTVPLPFNEEMFSSKQSLRIGYYTYDGFIHATPACERAVLIAKEALERKGHKLVPWTPPRVEHAYDLIMNGYFGDGAKTLFTGLENDKIDAKLAPSYYLMKMIPEKLRSYMGYIVGLFSPKLGKILRTGLDASTVHDWWLISKDRMNFVEEVLNHWSDNRLDAVICPGFAVPAVPYGLTITFLCAYTALYNLLDFPAGTVPVTRVSAQDIEQLATKYSTPDFVHKQLKKLCEDTEGLPVGVQVVSTRWKEELCLRLMKEIEDDLKSQ